MKKLLLLIWISLPILSLAQIENTEYKQMVEAEMKSASSTMNLAVNPNTQNYDITYHKLEFTVDPAVYFITGKVTTTFTAKSE